MGVYGYQRNISPNIDELAKNGKVFKHAFATGSSTPFSFTGMLSSTYPLDYSKIPSLKHPSRICISSILKEKGYLTAGFHSNAYLSSFYGYDRDFDVFVDLTKKKILSEQKANPPSTLRKIVRSIPLVSTLARKTYKKIFERKELRARKLAYLRAKETTNKVVKWIDDLDDSKLVFLWVHYMDPHHPYLSTEKFEEWSNTKVDFSQSLKLMKKCSDSPSKISKKELQLLTDLYDGEIHHVDSQLNHLLNSWEKKFTDSTIILTADHGDEFREHGEFSHKARLYDELIHVPLIILDPKIKQGFNEDLVSLLDLPTTVLGLNGIKSPPKMKGKKIFSKEYSPRDYIISETLEKDNKVSMDGKGTQKVAIRTKRWKYIYDTDGNEELYELQNDPQEKLNISKDKEELVSELRLLAQLHLKQQRKSRIKIV